METNAKLLEDSLLVIWNNRDAGQRLTAMAAIYADDIIFYESNEGPAIQGHAAINDVIAGLQSQWPVEFKFELTAAAKVNHQVQHIEWRLGIPGESPVATGMDIAIIDNGKIKSLHLLLDVPEK